MVIIDIVFDTSESWDTAAVAETLVKDFKFEGTVSRATNVNVELEVAEDTEDAIDGTQLIGEDSQAAVAPAQEPGENSSNGGGRTYVKRLTVADIIFVDRKTQRVLMAVERKSPSDFVSSRAPGHLQSKRFIDRLSRLKKSQVPRLGLLLTGNYDSVFDGNFGKSLTTSIVKLQMGEPQILVSYINSLTKNLPTYLARTVDALQCIPSETRNTAPLFNELMVAVRKDRINTPERTYQTLLQLIDGVGYKTAEALWAQFPTLSVMQGACRTEEGGAIRKLRVNNRAISTRVASTIIKCFDQ